MTMTSEEFIKFIGDLGFSSYIQLPFKENISVWQKEILPQLKFKLGLSFFDDDIKDCNSWKDVLEVINNNPLDKEANYPMATNPSVDSVRTLDNEKKTLNIQTEKLIEKLKQEKEDFERTLNKIDNTSPTINIKRTWYGSIKKDSIEQSLSDVYSSLVNHIIKCGNAIKSSNDHISTILSLLQCIGRIEANLYDKLGNNEVATNEFRELMRDWCKQNGIREEAIDKLFESSFARAYTLRDRINQLKIDIAANTEKISNIDQQLQSIKDDIEKSIVQSKDDLIKFLTIRKIEFNNLHNNTREQLHTIVKNATTTQTEMSNQSKREIQNLINSSNKEIEYKLSEIAKIHSSTKRWIIIGGATIVSLSALTSHICINYL